MTEERTVWTIWALALVVLGVLAYKLLSIFGGPWPTLAF